LVDDDIELVQMLCEYLDDGQYVLHCAHDGETAARMVQNQHFDLMVLDVMLPLRNGFALLQQVHQEQPELPVILLTAQNTPEDRIYGLELGADDYITKPFHARELRARIDAILRRVAQSRRRDASTQLTVGALHFSPDSMEAWLSGQLLVLTTAESRILELLMRHAGVVVPRDRLAQYGLGRKLMAYDRSIDTHINNLRRKLRDASPASTPEIRNLRGVGYLLLPAPVATLPS
jgi:DNA-binding response OmpR family regulator